MQKPFLFSGALLSANVAIAWAVGLLSLLASGIGVVFAVFICGHVMARTCKLTTHQVAPEPLTTNERSMSLYAAVFMLGSFIGLLERARS